MSVFKRNGVGNYYIQFNFNGRTYCKSSKTTNKRTAERMEREWKDEIHRMDELGERPKITLSDAIDQYVLSKQGTGSERFSKTNANVVKAKMDTGVHLQSIKDWNLAQLKSKREKDGAAPQTIKHNFQLIRNAVKWADDHGYLTRELKFPKIKLTKHRLRYLSESEEVRLLHQLDPKRVRPHRPDYDYRPESENRMYQDNYDLVVLLLDTGARYGEIANIKWDSIDLENYVIQLWRPKVRNESIVYMTSRVKAILERRYNNRVSDDFVFTNKKGQQRGYQSKGIRKAIKDAGIKDFRIHDLRHTCASRLVQSGLSLYEVANILGHTDISTTQIYAHLENKDISQKARNALEAYQTKQE